MRLRQIAAMLTAFVALAICAQGAVRGNEPGSCDAKNPDLSITQGFRAVRVIEDPASHRRWLIEQNLERPDWPARVIQVPQGLSCWNDTRRSDQAEKRNGLDRSKRVVQAGETLRIVEESPVFRADLEAVALKNGGRGDWISARLRIGGKVVRAIVAAPGRAVLVDNSGIESYR